MLLATDALLVLALALAIDAVLGDPDCLWRRWPHPVTWFGTAIAAFDRRFNKTQHSFERRRTFGVLALLCLTVAFGTAAIMLHRLLASLSYGFVIEATIASVLIAQRSLYEHVTRVADALEQNGLDAGRQAVSMVVGRDPTMLSAEGVSRAAIETAAENFCDGVVAPAFWLALFGLPGLVVFKVVSTADSMIGHMSERYRAFGWAAARLDDMMNLIPARLSAVLLAGAAPLAGGRFSKALTCAWRDAGLHRSPNAGWPEATMAGALHVALGGPRRYGDLTVEAPFLNVGGSYEASPRHIRLALRIVAGACFIQFVLIAALAWLLG
jgi:adenosylcobinamide-phosphate synthase